MHSYSKENLKKVKRFVGLIKNIELCGKETFSIKGEYLLFYEILNILKQKGLSSDDKYTYIAKKRTKILQNL